MYNGIGLTTARGSGTNAYVQKNVGLVRRQKQMVELADPDNPDKAHVILRQANPAILEHDRKRAIEVQCIELQEALEEEGNLKEEEMTEKVDALREKLVAEMRETIANEKG